MKTIALSARVDELNELADHVPVSVLASRLLAVVEAYLGANKAPAGTEIMACVFQTLDATAEYRGEPNATISVAKSAAKSEPPERDDHFFVAPGGAVGRRALLAEVSEEIAAHNEYVAAAKPGLPAEDSSSQRPSAGMSDSTRGQTQETEKPCKDCGKTRPLSEFPKNNMYKDGHTNKCKPCTWAYQKELRRTAAKKRAEKKAGPTKVTELPQPEVRHCAAGVRCVKADPDDLVPTPQVLDAANDHPSGLCRGCQRKAGVA